jgi:hypothetical protein
VRRGRSVIKPVQAEELELLVPLPSNQALWRCTIAVDSATKGDHSPPSPTPSHYPPCPNPPGSSFPLYPPAPLTNGSGHVLLRYIWENGSMSEAIEPSHLPIVWPGHPDWEERGLGALAVAAEEQARHKRMHALASVARAELPDL